MEQQNYTNHTRWNKLVHFVITPLLTLNFGWQLYQLSQAPSWDRGMSVVLAVTLIMISIAARLQSLKAQDRVIRLEERLRYKELLSPEAAAKAAKLRTGQIIALRFASDAELPGLVERVVSGELKTPKDIKLAVENWRPDHLRV